MCLINILANIDFGNEDDSSLTSNQTKNGSYMSEWNEPNNILGFYIFIYTIRTFLGCFFFFHLGTCYEPFRFGPLFAVL